MSDRAIHMFPCDDCAPAFGCWLRPSECGKARVGATIIPRRKLVELAEEWEALANNSERAVGGAIDQGGACALQAEADTWRSCASVLLALLEEVSDG